MLSHLLTELDDICLLLMRVACYTSIVRIETDDLLFHSGHYMFAFFAVSLAFVETPLYDLSRRESPSEIDCKKKDFSCIKSGKTPLLKIES